MGKVIIEAAINGNAMKEHNPNIPYSPEEIGRDAVATCQAGAALIHFHVRELKLRPTLQIFEPGFVRAALTFLDVGLLTEPLLLKFYFSKMFGLPPSLRSLDAYLGMLDGVKCNWFGSYIGGDVLPFVPLF